MKRFTPILVLLLLIVGISLLAPPPKREPYTNMISCPVLDLSEPTQSSCMSMLAAKHGVTEDTIQDRYGHEQALEVISSMDNLRYTTTDKSVVYGTGKCVIPPSMKSTFGLDANCRGTNFQGDSVQLHNMPRGCKDVDYTDNEYASNYDGCVVEEDQLRTFVPYAAAILKKKKDEAVAAEIQENEMRKAAIQQLQQERIAAEQQTKNIIREGEQQHQNSLVANAKADAYATLAKGDQQAATNDVQQAARYDERVQSQVAANPHLFGNSPPATLQMPVSWFSISSPHRNNFCLDVPGATKNDAQMIMWSCHNGANQKFSRDGERIKIQSSGKCLHAEGSGNRARVIQKACDNSPNQQWVQDGELLRPRNSFGRCLDVEGGRRNDGAPLIIWDCHRGTNQRWKMG